MAVAAQDQTVSSCNVFMVNEKLIFHDCLWLKGMKIYSMHGIGLFILSEINIQQVFLLLVEIWIYYFLNVWGEISALIILWFCCLYLDHKKLFCLLLIFINMVMNWLEKRCYFNFLQVCNLVFFIYNIYLTRDTHVLHNPWFSFFIFKLK